MLKRLVPVLFILILSFLFSDNLAQIHRGQRSNVAKVDMLGAIAFKRFGLAYERVINNKISAQLDFQVISDGYTISPELRYYLLRDYAPEGLFVSPFGRILCSNIGGGLGYGFGGLVGYQTLFASRLSADVFIGPGFNYLAKETEWDIWAGITLGLAF